MAFAAIEYEGNSYNEKLLPQTFGGANEAYYVVIGSDLSLTTNSTANGNTATFTINGTSYRGTGTGLITKSDDDRYYIVFIPKGNNRAEITITGTNNWTTQEHEPIGLPFSQNGTGSYFYKSSTKIDSIAFSNLDFLLINNVEFTNQNTRELPQPINGNYYIYYGSSNSNAELNLFGVPLLNVKVFLEGGF